MTWQSSTAPTRRLKLSDNEWTPSPGQLGAVDFLATHRNAAVWADPGAGKTSITLTAFADLQQAGMVNKMLVLAPLRVCQLVWRQEVAKWNHTRHLKVVVLHGDKKDAKLLEDGDIFLVNYEGLEWLASKFKGRRLPFDVIVADELTKLKNWKSKRFKAIKPFLNSIPYKWGLTGTPAPNGYLDLFGQFLFLDGGATLGHYYTHYRDQYFQPGWDGFTWDIRNGAEEEIEKRIAPIVYRLPYTDLPEFIDDPRYLQLDAAATKKYKTMQAAALVELEGTTVTAANAAAVHAKLRQMANGAVYSSEPQRPGKPREWLHVHDAKLDALEELVEELNGKPLLVAYSFHHDLERIRARLGKDIPHLGAGVTEKTATELQDKWNRNELPILLCHPDSVGHGLNLQQGNAAHICWFSADFNLELYDQFRRRIWRQGNKSECIFNHRLIVKGTIDELVYAALEDKDVTQARLLQSVFKMLDIPIPAVGAKTVNEEGALNMPITRTRLPTKDEVESGPTPGKGFGPRPAPEAEEAPVARGWKRAAVEEEEAPPQRQRIASKLAPAVEEDEGEEEAPAPVRVFSKSLQAQMAGEAVADDEEEDAPAPAPVKATRTRTPKPEVQKAEAAELPWKEEAPVVNTVGLVRGNADGARVHISFDGSPRDVRAAMLQLLGL